MSNPSHNLSVLRETLKKKGLDAYIIPVSGPHPGENIADHWQIVRWLTGFDGSAGTVVITDSFAGLWTDSRYYLQASRQLDGTDFVLMKPGPDRGSDYTGWLAENLVKQARIGLDGRIFPVASYKKIESALKHLNVMVDYNCDLISEIWKGRPAPPSSPVSDHLIKYAGREREVKIRELREEMIRQKIDYHLLTSCDDIMWLLNIRGKDVPFSPLLMSYAVIGMNRIFLFSDTRTVPPGLSSEFDKLGISILPSDQLPSVFAALPETSAVRLAPMTTPVSVFFSIPGNLKISEGVSLPSVMKAVKNSTEIENIEKVMITDGTALTRFFFWLDSCHKKDSLTELMLVKKLNELRSLGEGYEGPSFETIAAFNEHAALPHYHPVPETDSVIGDKGILLIDSGAHYQGGTTDITRTTAIGIPSLRHKKDFTLVLKGHIGLATAKFPYGTRGYQLDILARKALWESGLNYGHGTGHGVGYFLNVHEGPQSISPADNKTAIVPGMLTSNEPALYREGEYGIRTENLVLCYEDEETEFGQFLRFDTLSLCHIERSLIEISMLDQSEIEWLNKYHAEVYDKISPHLTDPEKHWLKTKTDPL